MEKTWKPTVAGILEIISVPPAFLFLGLRLLFESAYITDAGNYYGVPFSFSSPHFFIDAFFLILYFSWGILPIVGGIYALKRKKWRWALAGSIASLPNVLLGIPAVIYIVKSKNEFK